MKHGCRVIEWENEPSKGVQDVFEVTISLERQKWSSEEDPNLPNIPLGL